MDAESTSAHDVTFQPSCAPLLSVSRIDEVSGSFTVGAGSSRVVTSAPCGL